MAKKKHLKVTAEQMLALKYLVNASKHASEMTKRICYLLFDKSENLSREVCLVLREGVGGFTSEEVSEVGRNFGVLGSSNCDIHLPEILRAMGSSLTNSNHYGHRTSTDFNADGIFAGFPARLVLSARERPGIVAEGKSMRYTFWLAEDMYSRSATIVRATKRNLMAVDLDAHLYESLYRSARRA